jgi:hypothetical protein
MRRASSEPAQPTPDRAHRPPEQRGDLAMPSPVGAREQPRPDHRRAVRPTRQHERRQQHMSLRTIRTRRTPRPTQHHGALIPHAPRPRVTPRTKLALTARATQKTAPQQLVDLERVRTYHQHRVPFQHQATALPSGQGMGRAAALTGHRHALVANQEGQPNRVAHQKVLTINDAKHHPRRHPRRRSTPSPSRAARPTSHRRCA